MARARLRLARLARLMRTRARLRFLGGISRLVVAPARRAGNTGTECTSSTPLMFSTYWHFLNVDHTNPYDVYEPIQKPQKKYLIWALGKASMRECMNARTMPYSRSSPRATEQFRLGTISARNGARECADIDALLLCFLIEEPDDDENDNNNQCSFPVFHDV